MLYSDFAFSSVCTTTLALKRTFLQLCKLLLKMTCMGKKDVRKSIIGHYFASNVTDKDIFLYKTATLASSDHTPFLLTSALRAKQRLSSFYRPISALPDDNTALFLQPLVCSVDVTQRLSAGFVLLYISLLRLKS